MFQMRFFPLHSIVLFLTLYFSGFYTFNEVILDDQFVGMLLAINAATSSNLTKTLHIRHATAMSASAQRLAVLRGVMASQQRPLAAYIIPTADAHNSEYIGEPDARREWISGFTGSAGTAAVTSSRALIWTDGRYYTQLLSETDPRLWTLMKESLPETPKLEQWLADNLAEGDVVGVDPSTVRQEDWNRMKSVLTRARVDLVPTPSNLVDEARAGAGDPPPPRRCAELLVLPVKYTGKTAGQKVAEIREKMFQKKASALVVTALDEVASVLNLRGSDIAYNPVFYSYLLLTPGEVVLFWRDGRLSKEVQDHLIAEGLPGVTTQPYAAVYEYLARFSDRLRAADPKSSVWLSHDASVAIHSAAAGSDPNHQLSLISEVSPVALAKMVKNEVELEGFRACHARDGAAVSRLLRWLHAAVARGESVTEVQIADRLLEFRKEESLFMGESFATIAGAGAHGAVIHYHAARGGEQTSVGPRDVVLLDSGAQYLDGTTDITRTRHMGTPTPEQKNTFTRVLKGQIMLGATLFPNGSKGNVLDTLARHALWSAGLDYAHGTGHGVGHFLNVHEGPAGISYRPYPDDPGLRVGCVLSNEPGYYEVGQYGIRHEDLVEVIAVDKSTDHPRARDLVGDFGGRGVLGLRSLTLVPHQRACIDVALLDDFELSYLNSYHARVLREVGPALRARGLRDDAAWLEEECRPIRRQCAALISSSYAHIPLTYYEWGEPSLPVHEHTGQMLTRAESGAKLAALRTILAERNVDAYIIPTADAHNSQYIADADARREWVSGLSGSSGTAVVTASAAQLWTDGRYYTQFYMQVDTELWNLMTTSDLTIAAWLQANLAPDSVVAVDPTTYTRTAWINLQASLSSANITLQAISANLVDLARVAVNDPAPPRPAQALLPLHVNYTGRLARNKIEDLMQEISGRDVAALILTSLDDVAYTLNLRGSDIPYNPVFFSYLFIQSNGTIILFWNTGVLSDEVQRHVAAEGVTLETRPYEELFDYLRNYTELLPFGSRLWLSRDGSHAVYLAAESDGRITTLSTVSPVALMKCVKNDVELAGFRNSHIKDGIAVVRALRWMHASVAEGANITEMDLSDKLDEFRSEEEAYMGPSFATIAGAGENGAVIHYKPTRDEHREIRADDMVLVDSGGQYLDGTTDITRTRHLGTPTYKQRLTFTRVLKGQILMGTAVFPQGSTGNVIESFARKSLWDVGLNYAHGTGHGVGHFLNVHEGPSGIGSALAATDPGIVPAMIFSNEPGFYEVGEFGIRHEDLVEVIPITAEADHILADGMVGDFEGRGAVGFFTISLAPHQTSTLNVSLLNEFEIKYLNDYHARVLATLGPVLLQRGLTEDYDWLVEECAPIRSAAILFQATPLLIAVGFLSLWF